MNENNIPQNLINKDHLVHLLENEKIPKHKNPKMVILQNHVSGLWRTKF